MSKRKKKKLIHLNKEFGTRNVYKYNQEQLLKVLTEYELNVAICLHISNVTAVKNSYSININVLKPLLIQFCKDNWDKPKFINGLKHSKYSRYFPLMKWLCDDEYFNPNNLIYDVWHSQQFNFY